LDHSTLYACIKIESWSPLKIAKKMGGIKNSNRMGEFDQSTLHICTELSQWNFFVQIIYTNLKKKSFHYVSSVLWNGLP
jgi:hypothetical protein